MEKIARIAEKIEEANARASEHEDSSSSVSDQDAVFEKKADALFDCVCSLKKEWWEKTRELAEMDEKARVAKVVAEAEESQPDTATFQCFVCLEEKPEWQAGSTPTCCGAKACAGCWSDSREKVLTLKCCPHCRAEYPESDEEAHARLLKNANSGKAWAMRVVAESLAHGIGCQKDEGEAAHWYHRAAEQGDCIAQNELGGLQQSDSKALHYFTLSAKQGNPMAQFNLGTMANDEGNYVEAVRWWTLSAQGHAQGCTEAQYNLGCFHAESSGESGLKQSPETSLYYFEKAAMNGHVKGQLLLSLSLLDAAEKLYDGRVNLVRFSAVPRVLYFARAAAKTGDNEALSYLDELEKRFLTKCGNCNVDLTGGGEEARPKVTCKLCKAAVFCDLYCMAEHWTAGHKEDCFNCKELDALVESNTSKWGA